MNVLHINTNQEGGAALCAFRISNALSQQGVNCKMLVSSGEKRDNIEIAERDRHPTNILYKIYKHSIRMLPGYMDKIKFDKQLYSINQHYQPLLFLHHPYSDYKNIYKHPLIEWADIIHLHWVSDFVDYPSFFSHIKKPIVWTLHDMNPAIGLAHYETDYIKLPSDFYSLNKRCIKIKKRKVRKSNIHLVAISDPIYDVCQKSNILNRFPITKINNGVNSNIFVPSIEKDNNLVKGVDLNIFTVFLFSSFVLWDDRKGLSRLIEALEIVNCPNKLLLCLGSKGEDEPSPCGTFPIYQLGLVTDQKKLARIYSSSDFFVSASYQECFAQVHLESMSCGTPVISTPCGGSFDVIKPFNGIVCEGFDVPALAKGISEALSKKYDSRQIRDYCVAKYDYAIIAKKYEDMYHSILKA